jgi:hypothetical protein
MNKSSHPNFCDVLVAKYDRGGTLLWKRLFGGSDHEYGAAIALTSTDDIIVVGSSSSNDFDFRDNARGKADMFIMGVSASGKRKWTRRLGGFGNEEFFCIEPTGKDHFLVAGVTESIDGDFEDMPASEYEALVARIDSSGSWSESTLSIHNAEADLDVDLHISPNPFSSHTDVSIHIPQPSRLTVKVTDVMGHTLDILYDGQFDATRMHLRYDATKYATQVSYLVLISNGVSRVVKMVGVR